MKRPRGRPPHADVLTPSEWRTVHAVQHGMTNAEIARRRGVSVNAVKYHLANAMGKLGLRNRQELRAWFRAPRDSALAPREKDAMETQTRLGPIGQIARSVSDTKASETWYRDVLKLPHLYTFGTLAFFDCGGVRLMLGVPEAPEFDHPASVLYYKVGDIHAAWKSLSEAGADLRSEPHLVARLPGHELWMAFFRDSEGNILALMSEVPESKP